MAAQSIDARPRGRVLNVALWVAQVLLALFFIFAGLTKLLIPADQLAQMLSWTTEYGTLVPVTGVVDLLGGLGILLPALTRITPDLTLLAALGLSVLQVMAMMFHLWRGEPALVMMSLVLLALSVFVLWGRGIAAPITPAPDFDVQAAKDPIHEGLDHR